MSGLGTVSLCWVGCDEARFGRFGRLVIGMVGFVMVGYGM